MDNINVRKLEDFPKASFEVKVNVDTPTTHIVRLGEDYYKKLTGGKVAPEELIKKSFEFLLAREPNTAILREFDLKLISAYFPEYEKEISVKASE
jgi:hypothetical protein